MLCHVKTNWAFRAIAPQINRLLWSRDDWFFHLDWLSAHLLNRGRLLNTLSSRAFIICEQFFTYLYSIYLLVKRVITLAIYGTVLFLAVAANFLFYVDTTVLFETVNDGSNCVVFHLVFVRYLKRRHAVNNTVVNNINALGILDEFVIFMRPLLK